MSDLSSHVSHANKSYKPPRPAPKNDVQKHNWATVSRVGYFCAASMRITLVCGLRDAG